MIDSPRRPAWPAFALTAVVAGAFGFGAAHLRGDGTRNASAAQPPAAAATAPFGAPVQAAEGGGAEVKIPAPYVSAANIAVEAVGSGALSAQIIGSGSVVAAPNGEAVVMARASGSVSRVLRQLGDTVRAGQPLAQIDSVEAAAMAAERKVAAVKSELARKSLERENSLFSQGVTARQELEAAQSAYAVAQSELQRAAAVAQSSHLSSDGKSVAVVSPIAGKITAHNVTLGGFVAPQTELFRIAGDGPMLIEASLAPADIARVAVGDSATVTGNTGRPVKATVRSVTPNVSGATGAATVVLTPSAGANDLIAGEGVQVRLQVKSHGQGLSVPEDAVQNIDGHDVLFVRTKDGFRIQPVFVGTRSRGIAQIVSGIKAGELVATRKAFLIKADMIKSAKEE